MKQVGAMVKFFWNTYSRADRQVALFLFAGAFGLYLRTLAPGLLTGDSAEFQVAAWQLGLAHPTGYPLYLLLGSAWQHLLALFGLSPAYALNVFSAFFGAATVALLYFCMAGWLQSTLGVRRLAALFTALLFAVNFTFWSQNLIAEVYTLHTFFVLLIFLLAGQLAITPNVHNIDHPVTLSPCHPTRASLVPLLALLLGLSLAHHAMTLLLLPSLLLVLWRSRRGWMGQARTWLLAGLALIAPLLLYLYIPLRSGPAASPWYHQLLGTEPLTLYQNNWSSFVNFITGQSIAVGFRSVEGALQQLPQAWLLWRLHFLWPGVVLALLGLYLLIRQRQWTVLALTVPFFLLQQGFNLFYNIGDILVYYIPLYLIAAIWAGFAANAIGGGLQTLMNRAETTNQTTPARPVLQVGTVLVLVLFWLPIQLATRDFALIDQSAATHAQSMWQTIVDAQPPTNAILVSNDRNEIAPLFYLQTVEGQLQNITGLFPLIAPDDRFTDVGATLETALSAGNGQPVYLIKEMPGLAVKFALAPATPPLVEVVGPAATTPPPTMVDQPFGPLHLLGYDWQPTADGVRVRLHWQVQEAIAADYTTTVQLFAANGDKVAQNDAPPGGVYYPTSLWKPGEVLVEEHALSLTSDQQLVKLLVGMYTGADLTPLAPMLELSVPDGGVTASK
jgi:hypothetical protein